MHLQDFPAFLKTCLNDSKTQVEWAAALKVRQPQLNNLLAGRRSMNLVMAARWVRILELDEEQGFRFMRLAATTHIPPEGRQAFIEMVYELETLRRVVRSLKRG